MKLRARALMLTLGLVAASAAAEPDVRAEEPLSPASAPVTSLTILVAGSPPGTRVLLDGLPVEAGQSLGVRPGPHRVEVRAPGFFTEGRNVQALPAQNLEISFGLTPKEPEAGTAARRTIELEHGSDVDGRPWHPQLVAGVVIAVIGGLAGAGSGIAFAVYEDNRSDVRRLVDSGRCSDVDGATPNCASSQDIDTVVELDDEAYQLIVSSVALGAGAVFLVGLGIALSATAPSASATANTVRVLPILVPGTYGGQLSYFW